MSRTRARVRARDGREAKVRVERAARPSARQPAATSKPTPGQERKIRIGVNVALVVVAVLGAGLQLVEVARGVPGEHRLWLAVYLFVLLYAIVSLVVRMRKR